MQANPAREAFAQPGPEELEVDLLVGTHLALDRDRAELVGLVDHVHPAVVVVDDLADLLDDRPADRFDRVLAAHPGRGGLEHGQLGGPDLGFAEQVGVVDGDRGVGRDRLGKLDVARGPGPALVRDGTHHPDDVVVLEEWHHQLGTDLDNGVVALIAQPPRLAAPVAGHIVARPRPATLLNGLEPVLAGGQVG